MSQRVTAASLILILLGGWIGFSTYSSAQTDGNDPAPKLQAPGPGESFKYSLAADGGKLRGRGEFRTEASDKLDLSMPSAEGQYNFANESLSLTMKKKLFLDLRSAAGELSKHIETRPDGSTVTNGFTKTSDRLYEIVDNYDGTATINIYFNDQVKHSIKVEPNGGMTIKSNGEPPKETAAVTNP